MKIREGVWSNLSAAQAIEAAIKAVSESGTNEIPTKVVLQLLNRLMENVQSTASSRYDIR